MGNNEFETYIKELNTQFQTLNNEQLYQVIYHLINKLDKDEMSLLQVARQSIARIDSVHLLAEVIKQCAVLINCKHELLRDWCERKEIL
jgi:phage-related tail protein